MPEIKKYDFKIFNVEICQNCFSYRFNHDPELVFHGINTEYLNSHQSPILTPKGDAEAHFYYRYLKKRYIHLGPFSITGPFRDFNTIWYVFDKKLIKDPEIKYLNYPIWDDLHFHASAHPENERKQMEKQLFLPQYRIDPVTEILLPSLDCSLSNHVIGRNFDSIEKSQVFAGKYLESTIFDLDISKKIWNDYISGLDRYSDEEWKKFINNPDYLLPECECKFN